jgi:hypothetical protein
MKNLAVNFSSPLSLPLSFSTLWMTDYSTPNYSSQNNSFQQTGTANTKKSKGFFKKFPLLPIGIVVLFVAGMAVVYINHMVQTPGQTATQTNTLGASTASTKSVTVAKPLATETLNRNFDFPLNDSTGKEVSKIQYEIQSVELDNQIVVQGQIATAVAGREFLVLNLKITNNYSKSVQLNTRDYVRLVIDNSSDRLAADIHNDPVDVEAISTKYTRLGFPIDSNAKNLRLEVGEITGTKQTVQLNIK